MKSKLGPDHPDTLSTHLALQAAGAAVRSEETRLMSQLDTPT